MIWKTFLQIFRKNTYLHRNRDKRKQLPGGIPAGIPFFFIAATENTEDKTDYLCETITPSAMGIRLTDDKFADHLNIQHQGVVTVLESPTSAPEVKMQNPTEETGTKLSRNFSAEKETTTKESGMVTASELLNAAIKNLILEQYSEEISIVWGTNPLEPTKGNGQDRNTRN
ncbi:MAG: hypothetical protein HFG53_08290 [Lachnospiraceae bacterium]|nr:hypothetical protein [Lachnospiraceae bacterium]